MIKQNPYRVLGLFANSSERELQKQIAVIRRFSEVGKSKSFESDFDFIGDVPRSSEDVQQATGEIEQAHKKIRYANFWFVRVSKFDEIAFNNLKDGNHEKAIEVWNRALQSSVTVKNYSAYHNISTLYFALAFNGAQLDLSMLKMGVDLKRELFNFDNLSSLIELIGGSGIAVDDDANCRTFVDDVIKAIDPLLGKDVPLKNKRIVALFDGYPEKTKKYVLSKFIEEPFQNIENAIDKSEERRGKSPAEANYFWEILSKSTKKDIDFLRTLLGKNDLRLQMIVDKLSDEILQCSVVYFNELRDSDIEDPGEVALKIAEHARSLGPKGSAENRVVENLQTIQDWVDDKPQRDSQAKVLSEVTAVASMISEFDNAANSRAVVNRLILGSRSKLKVIKDVLGSQDAFYLEMSSAVVGRVLGGIIDIHNHGHDKVTKSASGLDAFKNDLEWVVASLDKIQLFDMSSEIRTRLVTNRKVIVGTKTQVEAAVNKSSGGCYIATMAYGDCDHAQVLILRKYRDEVLAKSVMGRQFIRFYYATSPYLVSVLGEHVHINFAIRKLLDKLIEVTRT